MSTPRRRARPGLTLLEATVAVLLVGLVLVAALHVLAGTTGAARLASLRATGLLLAEDLMAEVLATAYADPDQPPLFGAEADESGPGRTRFDDVDDYAGWTSSPPRRRDGSAIDGLTEWSRSVTVEFVAPDDPTLVQARETGVKRITVIASLDGKVMARLVALRGDGDPPDD